MQKKWSQIWFSMVANMEHKIMLFYQSGAKTIKTKKHRYLFDYQCFNLLFLWIFKVHFYLDSVSSGAGGSRTLVQTRNNYAFYILILLLVFVPGKETDILIQTLSPWVSRRCRSFRVAIPKLLSISLPDRNREAPSARCLVLSPCERMKLQSTVLRLSSESVSIFAN